MCHIECLKSFKSCKNWIIGIHGTIGLFANECCWIELFGLDRNTCNYLTKFWFIKKCYLQTIHLQIIYIYIYIYIYTHTHTHTYTYIYIYIYIYIYAIKLKQNFI